MESIWITGKRFKKSIFYVWFTQRSSSKISIWRRAKKGRRRPWSRRDEDYWHKWRQTKSRYTSNADILRQGCWLRVLQYRWNYRRTTWSQLRQQISELQFDKFVNPRSFFSVDNSILVGAPTPNIKEGKPSLEISTQEALAVLFGAAAVLLRCSPLPSNSTGRLVCVVAPCGPLTCGMVPHSTNLWPLGFPRPKS